MGAGILLSAYYDGALPRTANPAAGRVRELQVHGGVVYMTFGEAALFYGMFLALPVLLGIGGAIAQRFSRR